MLQQGNTTLVEIVKNECHAFAVVLLKSVKERAFKADVGPHPSTRVGGSVGPGWVRIWEGSQNLMSGQRWRIYVRVDPWTSKNAEIK